VARGSFGLWILAAVLAAASPSACTIGQPRSQLFDKVGNSDLTLGQLQAILRDCARRFPAVLEQAADDLSGAATTAEQRQQLLEFKANGAPTLQSVLLGRDPVVALLDGWALLYQLRDALRAAAATSADRRRLADALATVDGLAGELAALWSRLTGGDAGPARARVEGWARAHPLRGSLLARDSTAPLLAGLIDRSGLTMRAAAGSALEDLRDMITRVDLLALNLPRQARWQAEAALGDLALSPEVARARGAFEHGLELIEPFSELAGDTSALIRRERIAILASVDRERRALERFLREERRLFFAELGVERDATLRQTDELAAGLIDRTFDRVEHVLARAALWTLACLMALAGVLALVWLILSRRGPRRRPAPAPGSAPALREREA
jgi:hypothetical protein